MSTGPRQGDWPDNPALPPEERDRAFEASSEMIQKAEAAEPEISATVQSVANTCGGKLRRFETRFKTMESLYRKVQDLMVTYGDEATDAAARVKDVLRYTVVVDDFGYWTRGTTIGEIFALNGCTPAKRSPGWLRNGYRGRNDSFTSENGFEFEVQIHTRASLEVAEQTHWLYEKARDPAAHDNERKAARQELRNAFASVPEPDDVQWVD